jgi:hypothetical protein
MSREAETTGLEVLQLGHLCHFDNLSRPAANDWSLMDVLARHEPRRIDLQSPLIGPVHGRMGTGMALLYNLTASTNLTHDRGRDKPISP